MHVRSVSLAIAFAATSSLLACSTLATDPGSIGEVAPAIVPGLAGPPLPIEGAVEATEGNEATTLIFTPPQPNGSRVTGYEYDVNEDATWRPLARDMIVRALANGTSYRFRVRGVNGRGPSATPSDASNVIVPYGAPASPVVSGHAKGSTLEWTWTAPDGNGRTVTGYESKLDDEAYSPASSSTSFHTTFADGATHTLCVKALSNGDVGRNESAESCCPVSR